MARNNIQGLTVEIGGDTTKLGKALEDVNKKSRDLSSELGDINRLLKLDPGNTDLLAQKQKVLAEAVSNTKEKLDKLKEAEKQVQKQFERGEVSEEQVRALQREIIATEKKLGSYEKAIKETSKGLDKMEDETKEVEEASEGLGTKLGSLAKGGLKAVTAGVTALFGAMVASAEATREYRTEMGKLDTAFTTNGHSSETAKKTYQELQGVLGETEQAVEAANHLAKLADNEQELSNWTNIATGVYATFGASLPIEGLTEAANETAKTGALTGALADALNWAGVNEESFQTSLDACSSEQERQTLIMETLNGLYSDAADKYRETNAEIIRANEANEAWMASTAEVGEAIEPILTDVKLLGASLVSDLVPGVKEVAEAFRGVLNGDEGAATALGASLSNIFTQVLDKVTDLLPTVAHVGTELIATLATTILERAPLILGKLIEVASSVVSALAGYLPTLLPDLMLAILGLFDHILMSMPQILTAVTAILNGIVGALPDLLIGLAERIPELVVELLYGVLPDLLTVLTELFPQLLTSILNILTENLPFLIGSLIFVVEEVVLQLVPQVVALLTETLPLLIETLVTGLATFIPVLLEAAISLFNAIVQAVPIIIEQLLPVLPSLIDTILSAVTEALPLLLTAAIDLFFAILDAIPVLLDALTPALPVIIETILSAVIEALPLLLDAAVTLLLAIVKAIPKIIGPLTQQLPSIISTITSTLVKNLPLLISAAVKLFFGILEAIPKIIAELGRQLPSIIKAIVSGLGKGLKDVTQIGTDLVKGLWNGIKDMTSWITGKLKGFGDSVLSGIKNFFGIKSPSRVFKNEVGKMLAIGLAEGIEDNADAPLDAMSALSGDLLGEAGGMDGLALERRLQHTFAAPEALSNAESGILSKLDNILTAIERGQILTIDGKTWVGATADATDSALGVRRALVARGAM